MKIYVASSWRNYLQQGIVTALRNVGHEVYDFKNPPHSTAFGWKSIDPDWLQWSPEKFREALKHPRAIDGFESDFDAMCWADACVLVLPCGRSAHLEAGWFAGAGKPLHILMLEQSEPELMYKFAASISINMNELFDNLGTPSIKE